MHFRYNFEPRFSEVDKSLFLSPPLRTTSCNVHYSGSILHESYDNERETWSKSIPHIDYGLYKLVPNKQRYWHKDKRCSDHSFDLKISRINQFIWKKNLTKSPVYYLQIFLHFCLPLVLLNNMAIQSPKYCSKSRLSGKLLTSCE